MPFRTRNQARAAAHESWARTTDRAARTAAAREAQLVKLESEVDPDGVMTPGDRRKAARNALVARMLRAAEKAADLKIARTARIAAEKAAMEEAGGDTG